MGEMRARAARDDGFVPLEGDGAHLPHPHSDHVRMEMYGATVRCRARDVRLVLPESEDVVVDVYSARTMPRTGRTCGTAARRSRRRYSPSRNSCEGSG